MKFNSITRNLAEIGLERIITAAPVDYRASDGILLRQIIDNQKVLATALQQILGYIDFKESK